MSEFSEGIESVTELDPQAGQTKLRPRAVSDAIDEYNRIFPRVRSLFENIVTATFTDGTGGTVDHDLKDLEIPHNLGDTPTDVIVGVLPVKAYVYKGTNEWTKDFIYLRASEALTVQLYVVA